MKTLVIAGGGVVSVFSALYVQKKFDRIIIIEKSDKVGGLLSSFKLGENYYDYGTHIPGFTNDKEVDELLYGNDDEIEKKWHRLPYLRSENFFSGSWNFTSPLINVKSIAEDLYLKGLNEILSLPKTDATKENLADYLFSAFGETITNHVYRPVFKKLLMEEIENLHTDCLRTFGLQRVILLNPESTVELKKIPIYDSKIGFHSYKEGAPPRGYIYPKGNLGIGKWIEMMLSKNTEKNIEIMTNSTIEKIISENGNISKITLANGTSIDCDYLIWSLPAPLAMKNMGLTYKTEMPGFITTTLFHYEFDKPLLKEYPQYLLCWDPNYFCYRMTLYPNISEERSNSKNACLTVEVLNDKSIETKLDEVNAKVFAELKDLKIIPEDANIVISKSEYLGNSFPKLSEKFSKTIKENAEFLEGTFSNFKMIGRHSGKAFFITDTILHSKKVLGDI